MKKLVWNPKTGRNERINVPKRPQGIRGQLPRKRSFMTDMCPLKCEPRHVNGLSGAEKRRKRKGGNPEGGPGGGGIQGSMKRLKALLDKNNPDLRGHRIGKGFS